jgi:hypothetical protein
MADPMAHRLHTSAMALSGFPAAQASHLADRLLRLVQDEPNPVFSRDGIPQFGEAPSRYNLLDLSMVCLEHVDTAVVERSSDDHHPQPHYRPCPR